MTLPLTREEAWEAISDPAELERWLAEEAELEAEPGGDVAVRFDDGSEREGVVEEAEPGERLALRWWDVGDPWDASRVEFILDDAPEGTRLIVVETSLVGLPLRSTLAWGPKLQALASASCSAWPARPRVDVFAALADPTRRHLVERLAREPDGSLTELSADLPVTRQAVAKHLAALRRRRSRDQRSGAAARPATACSPAPLRPASAWIDRVGVQWDDRLDRLRRHADARRG